ncbi:hypothetical protein GUJ93_ZPchr0002g24235 [Zizania palustris]|uniref:Uncharacterized protein n=1 Tax=Zizania palustris TaxID=103762 RepID=A0A8J5VG65_ZIZPA|nr:hypothetical protein GUJ93_ZPchr0002g24235 [Zizania palustris]
MGICMSVAVYAAHGRGAVRRRGEVAAGAGEVESGAGGCEYGLLGGRGDNAAAHDALEVEEKEQEEAAAAKVVKKGGAEQVTLARPIWQRRVLMGVKCQLPRFSGMVLYDERGRPVCSGAVRDRARDQEKHAAAIMVLTDML